MAVVREILSQEEFRTPDGSSQARGITIGKTTVDLLKPFRRLLDLLDAPEDIPFLSNLIQREIVYRLLRGPHGERLRAIARLVHLRVVAPYAYYGYFSTKWLQEEANRGLSCLPPEGYRMDFKFEYMRWPTDGNEGSAMDNRKPV